MMRTLPALLAAGLLLGGQAPAADDVTLEGTWKLASGVRDGAAMQAADVAGVTRTFTAKGFSVQRDGKTVAEGTYRLVPGSDPAAMDVTFSTGGREVVYRCIFRFRDGRLETCVAGEGRPRPASFAAPTGSQTSLFVWERTGGAGPASTPATPQGTGIPRRMDPLKADAVDDGLIGNALRLAGRLPRSPGPNQGTLTGVAGDKLTIDMTLIEMVPAQETRRIQVKGVDQEVTVTVLKPFVRTVKLQVPRESARVVGPGGTLEKIDPAQQDELFRPGAAMLISTCDEIDPFYLEVVKPGTLAVPPPPGNQA